MWAKTCGTPATTLGKLPPLEHFNATPAKAVENPKPLKAFRATLKTGVCCRCRICVTESTAAAVPPIKAGDGKYSSESELFSSRRQWHCCVTVRVRETARPQDRLSLLGCFTNKQGTVRKEPQHVYGKFSTICFQNHHYWSCGTIKLGCGAIEHWKLV